MRSKTGPDGFTLVELVIAIMVTLIIMAPLATAFVVGLRTTTDNRQDVTNSADTQVLAAFFDIDVSSALTVATTSSCGTGTTLLALTLSDTAGTIVAYRSSVDAGRAGEFGPGSEVRDLKRFECRGGSTTEALVGRTLRDLPTVRCDAGSCASPRPRQIAMQVRQHSTQIGDDTAGVVTFNVAATRKVTP